MKKSLLPLHALGVLLAAPLFAQTGSPGKSNATESHDSISVTQAENGELADERVRLEDARRRLHDENNPEVLMHRDRIEKMEKNQRWLISLDFPGGSLAKLLSTVSQAREVSFNVIGADDSAGFDAELPAFSLHNANLETLFTVLHQMLGVRGFKLEPAGHLDGNSAVCVLRRAETALVIKPPPSTYFASYQLAPYLKDQSVDDIVGAIRTAWELEPSHDSNALHVKFHPGTSILLVSGPVDGINLSRDVIAHLKHAPEPQPKSPPPEAEKK